MKEIDVERIKSARAQRRGRPRKGLDERDALIAYYFKISAESARQFETLADDRDCSIVDVFRALIADAFEKLEHKRDDERD